jgi:hypothetical protein
MIYTAVFQDSECTYIFETHVSSHDRTLAWHDIHEKREDEDSCLVLLIDGQASVKTFDDVVDASD